MGLADLDKFKTIVASALTRPAVAWEESVASYTPLDYTFTPILMYLRGHLRIGPLFGDAREASGLSVVEVAPEPLLAKVVDNLGTGGREVWVFDIWREQAYRGNLDYATFDLSRATFDLLRATIIEVAESVSETSPRVCVYDAPRSPLRYTAYDNPDELRGLFSHASVSLRRDVCVAGGIRFGVNVLNNALRTLTEGIPREMQSRDVVAAVTCVRDQLKHLLTLPDQSDAALAPPLDALIALGVFDTQR